MEWSLQFLGYLRTLSLKFQKARTKIEVFQSLPCWLSQFSWDSQQGRGRKTSTLLVAFWNSKSKVLKYQWNFRPHATVIPNLGNVRVLYSYYLYEAKWPLSDKLRINWLKSYSPREVILLSQDNAQEKQGYRLANLSLVHTRNLLFIIVKVISIWYELTKYAWEMTKQARGNFCAKSIYVPMHVCVSTKNYNQFGSNIFFVLVVLCVDILFAIY